MLFGHLFSSFNDNENNLCKHSFLRERIEESKDAFMKMIKNENTRGVPLLVAANKQG